MAGIRLAGKTVVKGFLILYIMLAGASFTVAGMLPVSHARAVPAAEAPLYVYQQLAGPLDGRSCPSWPVCSLYARQALHTHGLLLGSWLMLDRLIHEGDDVKRGPMLLAEGGERLYDPLARNDRWLRPATHDR